MMLPRTPSEDAPYPSSDPTHLQNHVAAWDRNDDGLITPADTVWGMQTLGFSLIVAVATAIILHVLLSYPTQKGWVPDPFFRLGIAGIHRGIHASDSHIYNKRGIMDRGAFDDIFKMYGDPIEETLTLRQTLTLWSNNHDLYDVFGTWLNLGKWLAAWIVLKDESGKMKKNDLLALIEGSYFRRVFSEEVARKSLKDGILPAWSPIRL